MDILALIFFSILSILLGVILTLVIQYYALIQYFNKSPSAVPPLKQHSESCSLPESLRKKLEVNGYESSDSSLAITLMLQFLFHELRHSDSIRKWLYKKLSLELEELITKTTTGKFFEAVTIRNMHLGSQSPTVKSIGVESVKLDKTEGHIDTLNSCIKLDYTGNFLLSVDAKMKFGKTAYLSITVKRVSGLARLQFSRLPYTHWSFSFYGEPVLELAVESHFQGRQLQSNVTNLIVNQIKKAIKRKHTLPNYKIRYKPFFTKSDPGQLDLDDNEIIPQGQLELICIEMSRLSTPLDITEIYSTFTIDSLPWICIYQRDTVTFLVTELTISKVRQQPIGASFRQEQNLIIVDSVVPHSSADVASLKVGDIVLAVDGKTVSNIAHLNKIFRILPLGSFSVRIERIAINYIFKTRVTEKTETIVTSNTNIINENEVLFEHDDSSPPDFNKSKSMDCTETPKKSKIANMLDKPKSCDRIQIPKLISTGNENVSKFAQTIGNFTLRKRKASVGDGSNRSSPVPSLPNTPQHISLKAHKKTPTSSFDHDVPLNEFVEVYKGSVRDFNAVVNCNEEYSFNLKDCDKYLNVNVWGLNTMGKEVLLGYMNVPLAQILSECSNSMLGHDVKTYSFLPPTSTPPTNQTHPLMSHSGFEHVFCYGDVLLSFTWSHESAEVKRKVSLDPYSIKQSDTSKLDAKHEFVRTQFHRTTHCDFCSKKIWLKDAVQCKSCNLCCHKKCVSKCQLNTPCIQVDKLDTRPEPLDILQPEITMTEPSEDIESEISSYILLDQKQNSIGLKRVNSVNNLAIPGSQVSQSQSRSLPQSPQHTPRKLSLVASSPFTVCPMLLDELHQQPSDANEIISRGVEEVLLYPSDESLMDAAKESGMQMYSSMVHEDRFEKINLMVTELKRSLDVATVDHMALCKQLGIVDAEVEKAKLAFLIGQADAKIQALSVLMLHYCSGLQYAHEKIV